ncbi:unnamed protein product [Gongylonema pulchrum]|uniref:Large ribosomal subunit protein bL21m n=1 Tax=Gongylonema pulchrum TaxID=637853 RepID=A0A183ENF4_9BILA|nr:unnamed protein product [Gongylonema pulchrum]
MLLKALGGPGKVFWKQASKVVTADVVGTHKVDEVMNVIKKEWQEKNTRLFAIVYINRRQFKVSENDLIVLYGNVPLDIGDKINLEKVRFLNSEYPEL